MVRLLITYYILNGLAGKLQKHDIFNSCKGLHVLSSCTTSYMCTFFWAVLYALVTKVFLRTTCSTQNDSKL